VLRRSRLLAAPVLLLPLLALTGPQTATPAAGPSADRQALDRVFGKGPGAAELVDRTARDFTPLGATSQAFDAVGTTMSAVASARAVAATAGRWAFAGPKDGYYLDPGYQTTPAKYGHSSGIVPAMAADNNDPTGNTLYIGTHGGIFKTTDGGTHWTDLTLGKLPRLGIGALALDPRDSKTLYVGTGVPLLTRSDDAAGTGLYVSHDGGKTFTRGAYTGHGYGVNAISVSPTAVFAATADGLYRSTDRGASWVRVPLKTNAAHTAEYPGKYGNFLTDVAVQPGDPSHVTAAVGYGMGKLRFQDGTLASEGNGLYQSADGGKTFAYLASTSQLTNPTASSDPLGAITLHYSSAPGNGKVLYAVVGDAGKNRGDCEGGLPVPTVVDPVAGLNLTGALCATVINGFYRSADGGASWNLVANYETLLAAPGSQLTLLTALGIGPGYQTGYNKYIADDPTDPSRVVLGLEESYAVTITPPVVPLPAGVPVPAVFQVINKYWDTAGVLEPGTNGTPAGIPYYGGITTTHPDQHIATFVKTTTGSRLYAGNDGGIWRQDTGLTTTGTNSGPGTDLTTCGVVKASTGLSNCDWASLNSLPTVLPYHANMKPDGVVVAGLQDNGTVIIDKAGHGTSVCGGDGVQVGVTKDPKTFYCSTPAQGIQATTDGGKTFTSIYFDGTDIVGGDGLTAYAVDPTDGNHLMRAGRNVVETVDGPRSGDQSSKGFVQVFDAGSSGVKSIDGSTYDWSASGQALSGKNAYVGFCPGLACRGVVTRIDQNRQLIATNVKKGCANAKQSTRCWHKAAAKGLPFGQLVGIAIDPKTPTTLYVSMNTYNFLGLDPKQAGTAKVLVSKDAGEHFTDITANLPYAGANNVVLIGRRLFVATEVGAFTKLVTDPAWKQIGTGLPAVPVRDLQADLSGKHLVASMFGRGVWTFTTAGLSGLTVPRATPAAARAAPGGRLAATGMSVGVGALGIVLMLGAAVAIRRSRRA
jgi:hypothetical protein